MRAAVYEAFRAPLVVRDVPEPTPLPDAAVLEVVATGACLSDWHGWMGHDPDIQLPHVPGHEISGIVAEVGAEVTRFRRGDRVTVPFVCGCGSCVQCQTDNAQICDKQTQPGFTHWGSYAEYVGIRHADFNLVRLPDDIEHIAAASLGCRFATAYRAVAVHGGFGQGNSAGDWLAVHGCGGVGLSAIMIGRALGANVAAIDIDAAALGLANALGARVCINARQSADVVAEIQERCGGGAHVSIDAFGSEETCAQSILSLRKRGRHVQVGLLAGRDHEPRLPMHAVIAQELEIVGSHGMPASHYADMLSLVADGRLRPEQLVTRRVDLDAAARELGQAQPSLHPGITVIELRA